MDAKSSLRKDILEYLVARPNGMDTLQGIARFWILRQHIEAQIGDVEAAISGLVGEGYVEEGEIRDQGGDVTERYYHLNRSRMREVEGILRSGANPEE